VIFVLALVAGAAYFGGRYLLSPPGRYLVATRLWNGKPSRMKPVLEEAMARAARRLELPPPMPQLLCKPDSAGASVCRSTIALPPGVSTIQANAELTRALTALGTRFVSGAEAPDGTVELTFRAGKKVELGLTLLPAAGTGLDTTVAPAPNLPQVEVRARLALIIDDYGEDPAASAAFRGLPGTFTAAVRSNLDGAGRIAAEARQAGFEVILNLPMEPENYPTRTPGPDAILVDLSGHEIRKRVDDALDRVGPVPGVKSYMGALAVEDRDVVRPILEELKKRNLFFVDAAMSNYSSVPGLAHDIGVPYYTITSQSEVDHGRRDAGSIGIRFDDLVKTCRARGYAIGIIHAREGTLTVLRERLPGLAREGIVVMGLSEVMKAHELE
jgi:polysaccharide deacetylase 2 family uncharacterized protein YibQ